MRRLSEGVLLTAAVLTAGWLGGPLAVTEDSPVLGLTGSVPVPPCNSNGAIFNANCPTGQGGATCSFAGFYTRDTSALLEYRKDASYCQRPLIQGCGLTGAKQAAEPPPCNPPGP
jgi:hypothetical protein